MTPTDRSTIDYKDECEFKVVVKYDKDEYFFLNIESSLRAIILGPKLKKEYRCVYKKLIDEINIEILGQYLILANTPSFLYKKFSC